MLKRRMLWGLMGVGLIAGGATIGLAGDEEKTSLDQIPAKARAALLKLADGARITQVEQEKEHGMMLYEAEWTVKGREAEAKVTANGDLVEQEEKIDAKDLPAKVRSVAAKAFPAGTKIDYERKMVVVYEIEAKIAGKEKEILVLTTGQILGGEEDDEDDDN